MCASRRKVTLYYAAEGAFYTASIFMLVMWEERRKDFLPMLLHHIATVVLIAVSYLRSCGNPSGTLCCCMLQFQCLAGRSAQQLHVTACLRRYTRVGSIVMLLHDPSDIFLESAKLCAYADLDSLATALFAGLLLSWFALRLVLLPFWVIRSCMCAPHLAPFRAEQCCPRSAQAHAASLMLNAFPPCRFDVVDMLGYRPAHSVALTGLLCFLTLLHAYWFSLIANIAWSKITTGSANDTREDDE